MTKTMETTRTKDEEVRTELDEARRQRQEASRNRLETEETAELPPQPSETAAGASRQALGSGRAETTPRFAEPSEEAPGPAIEGEHALLEDEQRQRLRSRWEAIQASFIDEPRKSVAHADELVQEVTEALHDHFERERRELETVWDRGEEVSTEDLRVTLKRYRSFFERLLTI